MCPVRHLSPLGLRTAICFINMQFNFSVFFYSDIENSVRIKNLQLIFYVSCVTFVSSGTPYVFQMMCCCWFSAGGMELKMKRCPACLVLHSVCVCVCVCVCACVWMIHCWSCETSR